MIPNKNQKIVTAILITALVAPSAMAGLFTAFRCETKTKYNSETTGCAVGQGCYKETTTKGYCVENDNIFGTKCKPGSQTGKGISEKYPGTCSRNFNQDWVCVNTAKTARKIAINCDCGDVKLL
jgi:hypothetical protein